MNMSTFFSRSSISHCDFLENSLSISREITLKSKSRYLNSMLSRCKSCHEWFKNRRFLDNLTTQGSAVWLKDYQLFLMANRLDFSSGGRKNIQTLGISLELYDKSWEELYDIDLNVSYEKERKHFWRIIKFPFIAEIGIFGGRDPRIFLWKNYFGNLEPVIFFNINNAKMYFYQIFSDDFREFTFRNRKKAKMEKNWVPIESNQNYFIMICSLDPLKISQCEIKTGICDVFQGSHLPSSYIGPLRPGTSFIQLPYLINGTKIYVAWARAHIKMKSLIQRFYRPNLIIFSKNNNDKFNMISIGNFFDFGQILNPDIVISWNQRMSVLLPNSIAYWDFYEDIMVVNLHSQDLERRIVFVRGISDYILNLSKIWNYTLDVHEMLIQCATNASIIYSKIWVQQFRERKNLSVGLNIFVKSH